MIKLTDFGNLTQRIITGIILAALILTLTSWNIYSFIFLISLINIFSLREYYTLFKSEVLSPRFRGGMILSLTTIFSFALTINGAVSPEILLINIPVAFGILISELYTRSTFPFHNLAFTFSGILYITVPLIFFLSSGFIPFNAGKYLSDTVLGYFLILWGADSGAYFSGRAFGTHSLFKRISPNKTWEGSIGGGLCALVIAYINSSFFKTIPREGWITLAIIIVVAGTFGDLIKSMMKRSLKIKDSGTILPGHGGMLDRFDSLFGSAPLAFCYLEVSSRHV